MIIIKRNAMFWGLFLAAITAGFVLMANEIPFSSDAAKSAATGGAFMAVADDENAVFYNPAGLGGNNMTRIVSNGKLFFDWDYSKTDVLLGFQHNEWAASISFAKHGNDTRKILCFDNVERADVDTAFAVTVGLGVPVTGHLKAGLKMEYDYFKNDIYFITDQNMHTWGLRLHAGVIYSIWDDLNIGVVCENIVSLNNLSYLVRYDSVRVDAYNSFPVNFSVGISKKFFGALTVAIDLKNIFEPSLEYKDPESDVVTGRYRLGRSIAAGLEQGVNKNLFLRTGIKYYIEQPFYLTNPVQYYPVTLVSLGVGYENDRFAIDAGIIARYKMNANPGLLDYKYLLGFVYNL